MRAQMKQTARGFDALIIMKKEWMDELESLIPSHAAACPKDDNAKGVASPETTHVFN
jgi:hypothetical protein